MCGDSAGRSPVANGNQADSGGPNVSDYGRYIRD